MAVLRAVRVAQAQERLLLGRGYVDHDLVLARPNGKPWHPERFSRTFGEQVTRRGLPPLSVHGLRHTWATLALKAGVHPKVVQERLGHSTVSITLDIYSRRPDSGMRAANSVDVSGSSPARTAACEPASCSHTSGRSRADHARLMMAILRGPRSVP